MKNLTRNLVSRRPVAAALIFTLLFPAAGIAQPAKPGDIDFYGTTAADTPAAWSDVPTFTLNGDNGWVARRQSKPLGETETGQPYTHERLVFQSPWGEKAEFEAVIVPSEAGGANGTMLVSFGNLEMEIVGGTRGFSSFAVSDGTKWAQDVASLDRQSRGPGASQKDINLEPYEMIANELHAQFSPEFLEGIQANLAPRAAATPVRFSECLPQMGSCIANLALWGVSIVALTGCFATGLVPACIATIIGHAGTGSSAVVTCTQWIHCENGNDPCN